MILLQAASKELITAGRRTVRALENLNRMCEVFIVTYIVEHFHDGPLQGCHG